MKNELKNSELFNSSVVVVGTQIW